jgi:hypothetical protein
MRQVYIPCSSARKATELARQMRLIGETALDGDRGGQFAALQMSQCALKPDSACERLGRETDSIQVSAFQLPRAQSACVGERVYGYAAAAIERHTYGMLDSGRRAE